MHLTHGLHRSLRLTPDEPATVFGDRVRSFAELADRVARLAGGLRSLGVDRDERVAILALNSDRYVELLLAVPWADGAVNPVNIRWSVDEIVYSLVDSQTSTLVVDDAFAPLLERVRAGHPGLRAIVHADDDPATAPAGTVAYEELLAASAPIPDARRGGDAVAGVMYTGGTTGFPKGVQLTHTNLITSALGAHATFPMATPGGRSLHAAPLFHIAGVAGWVGQTLVGGTHVLVPAFDPEAVLAAMAGHEITSTVLVPTMIQRLADHPGRERYDVSSVRTILYGGSPITEGVLRRAMKAFPRADFLQAYGMTEVAPIATMLTPEDHRRGGPRLGSGGRAAVHSEVRIVDEDGHEVPEGTVGEITVRGDHVMIGYWGNPEESARALRDGWMHTGDAGYLDDEGYLFVVERLKDMIVAGGENVYSAEVENALGRHPAVAACAVIGVPDETWGERVHAVVVFHPEHSATVEELRAHTKSLIAGYKTPRTFELVDALPLSATGKVLKHELRTRPRSVSQRP